jgi:hypothetical protein
MGSMQACVVLMFAAVLVCGTWEGDLHNVVLMLTGVLACWLVRLGKASIR